MSQDSAKSRRGNAQRVSQGVSASTPDTLGDWRLCHCLGSGRFTTVWQARPLPAAETTPPDYVIKVLRPSFRSDPSVVQMLFREAALARHIQHPHLVTVLEAHLDAETPFLVMPYLEGVDLQATLDHHDRLPLNHGLWMARQTAEALTALHGAGWLHGDVKPSNVHGCTSGHVTLLDLGLARALEEPGGIADRPLTGTYHYIAPELFVSTSLADQRSDLYSLGVMLFQLISGHRPIDGEDESQIAAAHLEQTPADIREFCDDVPEGVAELLRSLLAKDPMRRPGSAQELVKRLMRLEIVALAL
jgi:serine/threonine protein kinase